MNILKRKSIFLSVFFFMTMLGAYVLSYHSGIITKSAQAQISPNQHEVIKIPPPIEGVVLKDPQHPQSLDTTNVQILTSSGETYDFKVELAKTHEQRRIGLMFRNVIRPKTGMLFLFEDVRERSFWMKNTWIDLDIIFIRSDGVIHNIHQRATPRSLEHVKSNGVVGHVLEIGGGEAQRLGLTIGDRVIYEAL